MNRVKTRWYRPIIQFKINQLATVTMSISMLLSGCGPDQQQRPETPYSSVVDTWVQHGYLGSPECLQEGVELAGECNEGRQLPWCPSKDGSGDGVWCFWRDSNGSLWFNDGDPATH